MYAFGSDPWRFHPRAATLKSELQKYAESLFLAEGQYYVRHARDESELREWLSSLASCVEAEVIAETDQWSNVFDHHCSASERRLAVAEVLRFSRAPTDAGTEK
jgi:hypothetical protein